MEIQKGKGKQTPASETLIIFVTVTLYGNYFSPQRGGDLKLCFMAYYDIHLSSFKRQGSAAALKP